MPLMKHVERRGGRPKDFEATAVAVIRRLRSVLRSVIGNLPQHERIGKPVDLQRALRLDSKLAWQVHRLAFSVNPRKPLSDGVVFPKTASLRRFLAAARAHGVDGSVIESAESVLHEMDQLIELHAGDYSSFESMLSGMSEGGVAQVDFVHKRAAFKAQSHIWGVQAKSQFSCFIYNPSSDNAAEMDMAVIHGLVDLRRLRKDTAWKVACVGVADDDGVKRRTTVREPIAPGDDPHGIALMPEFCSRPLPAFRSEPAPSGATYVLAEGETVGNQSATSCVMGSVTRRVFPRYQDDHNRVQLSQTLVRTPCEVLLSDLLVPEGMLGEVDPVVEVFGDQRSGDAPAVGRDSDLLSLHESVTCLGHGFTALHTADVPQYEKMIRYAFDRLDWDADQFEVWRCRVAYPVMPTSVVIKYDLPDSPLRSYQ